MYKFFGGSFPWARRPRRLGKSPLAILKWAAVWALFLMVCSHAPAQGPTRSSVAGSDAAASRNQLQGPPYYNLRMGEFFFRADAAFGVEFNDNVSLADKDSNEGAQADLIVRPRVNINASWQVSRRNRLQLTLGAGVDHYLKDSTHDTTTLAVAPGSQISFDIYAGDFKINLHEQLAVQQDPISEGAVSNTSRLGRLTNTVGTSVLWDLNKVMLGADYNLTTVKSISSSNTEGTILDDYLQNSLQLTARIPITKDFYYGVFASGAYTAYTEEVRPNVTSISVGPFCDVMITHYTRVSLSAGYRMFRFDSPQRENQVTDPNIVFLQNADTPSEASGAFFGELGIFNQVNQWYNHNLTVGVQTENGFYTGLTRITYVRYAARWALNPRVNLGIESYYERSTQDGFAAENYSRYGLGLSTGFYLTRRLNAAINYRLTHRESNLALRNYVQNAIGMQFSYAF